MARKPPKGKSLAEVNPELAKQWHSTKNGDLNPSDVSFGSAKKVWWKCNIANDHVWEARLDNRNHGKGCPFCSGQKVTLSNCLHTMSPSLSKEWDNNKNILTPFDVTAHSRKEFWWKCDQADDHKWKASVDNRSKGKGCPMCSGNKVVYSNSLATNYPLLAKEWHKTKNGKLTPDDLTAGSNKKVWWKCNQADDHEWKSRISHRTNEIGCPVCSNKKVVLSNCLSTTHPDLSKQWHHTKNVNLTPKDVTIGSSKKVWWKCSKGECHEWPAVIVSRKINGCPFCTLTPQSKQELTIAFELIQFFQDINPKGFKTRVKGKFWSIDIYIPQLKLGIEFDGNYWHKDKQALDKLKTKKLEDQGFKIFRVREEPLEKIFDDDIMSKQPFNAKQVANDILTQIMSRYSLAAKKIAKIESYIAKIELQNEKGLDKYIDMILTEKAEKKN